MYAPNSKTKCIKGKLEKQIVPEKEKELRSVYASPHRKEIMYHENIEGKEEKKVMQNMVSCYTPKHIRHGQKIDPKKKIAQENVATAEKIDIISNQKGTTSPP